MELYAKYNGRVSYDHMGFTADESTKFNEGITFDNLFETTQGTMEVL